MHLRGFRAGLVTLIFKSAGRIHIAGVLLLSKDRP